MAYFTHIQLKCNWRNFQKISKAFFVSRKEELAKNQLAHFYPNRQIIFTDMGRTALRIILEKMNLEEAEIIMPSYICDIFYPILEEFRIKPIFIDATPATFNLDVESIEEKISKETKAIIVCHTYGKALEMEKILKIADKYNLKIIEDIAHSIGEKYQGEYLGNFGDASFASLYKQFPTLRGGMVIAPKDWQVKLKKTHFNFRDFISLLNYFSFFSFILKKFLSKTAPKFLRKEKHQNYGTLNRISLNLFANYLPSIEANLEKRKEQALLLIQGLEKMGFICQVPENNSFTFLSAIVPRSIANQRDEFVKKLRKKGIFLTRIWHTPIILNPEVQKVYEIDLANFPQTCRLAKGIVNIPLQNHFTNKDCLKILHTLNYEIRPACHSEGVERPKNLN